MAPNSLLPNRELSDGSLCTVATKSQFCHLYRVPVQSHFAHLFHNVILTFAVVHDNIAFGRIQQRFHKRNAVPGDSDDWLRRRHRQSEMPNAAVMAGSGTVAASMTSCQRYADDILPPQSVTNPRMRRYPQDETWNSPRQRSILRNSREASKARDPLLPRSPRYRRRDTTVRISTWPAWGTGIGTSRMSTVNVLS
ncbi:hypothetical protein KC321_g65 [Hortaea werneckii]|nr:hypothetical protein KC321_g65 [Hortaea werneckii]